MSTIERALNKAKNEDEKSFISSDLTSQITDENRNLENNSVNFQKTMFVKDDTTDNLKKNTTETPEIQHIDWDHLASLGFVTPSKNSDATAQEEYRNIKRPLLNNAFGVGSIGINRSNLILVTSSVPGEGKTYSTINLALSIANERDKKVLLIDADVARPSISKALGIKSSPGLIEYLEGQAVDFSDIILKTNMPGLSIIPAGKQHKHSTELLSSNRMIQLTEQLSSRYPDRLVIFDSPPLLAATQGEVLAGLVGQVVLVVEAEKTPQSMVMASVGKLVFCDIVLLLLNKTKTTEVNHYGYGTYGH